MRSTTKFKVGDKVIITKSIFPLFNEGDLYEIVGFKNVSWAKNNPCIKLSDQQSWGYESNKLEFELAKFVETPLYKVMHGEIE